MTQGAIPDHEVVRQHRTIWAARPELRAVYHEWFRQLLRCVEGLYPVVEIGAGPGFFKEYFPQLISTDVVPTPYVDVVCDAGSLPFQSGSVGGLVMVDVLHHLPKPLEFLAEAGRILQPGGRLAMIEPWITVPSYLLYRYFHHEDCSLAVDVRRPFGELGKRAFDGNAAIPFKLLKQCKPPGAPALRLLQAVPFLGLPYLATLGFRSARPIPRAVIGIAKVCERLLSPLRKWASTRILIVWELPLIAPATALRSEPPIKRGPLQAPNSQNCLHSWR
jgi:SAM-dependent methyltransferase